LDIFLQGRKLLSKSFLPRVFFFQEPFKRNTSTSFAFLEQKTMMDFGRKDEAFGDIVDFFNRMSCKMSYKNCVNVQKAKKEEKSEKKCLTKKRESSIIYRLSRRRHHDQRLGQAPKKLLKKF
jgi:hypothetical protein